ncbi:hypothetical protein [Ramlibacter sp.]|uniref:hypothetical protein n=1 Tax=Ramlibacter sp. TaxID=1917967 RepID=UPI0035B10250
MWKIISALLVAAATAGCTTMIAGAVAVGTPEEIKRSSYVTSIASPKPLGTVSACLKTALLQAKSGSRPAQFSYRDTGAEPHQFIISNNVPSTWSGARPEILALVESSSNGRGGSVTQIWAHPRLLSDGGSQGYLDRTVELTRPCTN